MSQTKPTPLAVDNHRAGPARGVAQRVADVSERMFGLALPVGLRAWDGSRAGPAGGPVIVIRSPRAIRHLLRRPGELGLARAYVTGEIDVEGDLRDAMRRCRDFVGLARAIGLPATVHWPRLLAVAVRLGAIGTPPAVPAEEARLAGRAHTPDRDRAAVAHHYDLGNEFYESILDPSMTYSCGYWASEAADYGLAEAQRDKLDLVCRKLALNPGSRLLDVGCGWGSLILHAAEHYGVRAVGVTISARQHEFVQARAAECGLGELVEVRLQDYRAVRGEPFDAVSSIEMGEHVGERNYPGFCTTLRRLVRPGGRLLLQQMSRGAIAPGGGAFIGSYIAPDMAMRPLNRTLGHLENVGLEIRDVVSMREHYVRTIDAWADQLESKWDELVYRHGVRRARVWRLYLAGSALAFERHRMSVHQVLAVHTTSDGYSRMPLGGSSVSCEGAESGGRG